MLPNCPHGHRIFTDRDADAELWAESHRHRLDGFVELVVLGIVTRSHHPIRRQFYVTERLNIGTEDIRQRLTNSHATRGRRIEQCQRRALSHRHRLTRVTIK